ncbi:Helix-turn-helix domain-containing protein [Dyadobacter sp. SG02]|uniref:helix-turn-helix domain-containing protein n=1 Tax=Dyadobacter sp. SG02 TaxID=1855291 RepID=UPI0008D5503E|nr:helix-turn-helix domain-containing protein [Dyadobacter sp. SG02]SEJ00524.1 Helix-turn-helix domain-containing protein [Dyadobacter sp. SG02]
MTIQTFFPTPELSPFIKSYKVIETPAEVVNHVLPETSPVMVFRLSGQVCVNYNGGISALEPITVSGLRKSGRAMQYESGTINILATFREGGIAPFVREPLHELSDTNIPMDSLDGFQHTGLLEEQLAEQPSHEARIALIERFLLDRLSGKAPDHMVLAAIQKIHGAGGQMRIKELAASLNVSQDAFEKRFRRVAGLSAKQFSYIVKMKSVVANGRAGRTLAQIALDAGYFDQPHFNKDFKLFTGVTPTEFFKSPVLW